MSSALTAAREALERIIVRLARTLAEPIDHEDDTAAMLGCLTEAELAIAQLLAAEAEQGWRPIAEAHEDFGTCVFINIHDPGSPCCASTLELDYQENLEYYEWTHFKRVTLTQEEADELLAALPAPPARDGE